MKQILAALIALSAIAAGRPDQPAVIEEIVAKVNGDIIPKGDLLKAPNEELKDHIDQLLLIQKAKERDINVDADLNREIAAAQSASKQSDPDKFHEWLRAATGTSYEDFRQTKKNELLAERIVNEEVWRNIVIPDADIQEFYDAHKTDFIRTESVTLRMILVSTGKGEPETIAAAQKRAAALLARARGTADKFSDLARQYSDDPTAADDGLILLPWERGKNADPKRQLNKAIEDVVFNHEKGYITDLIQIRGAGFEFFRIEDHIPEGQASLDDVKNQISSILARPLADPKLRAYLTTLRENAFLQIKPGYTDTGAAPGKDTTWKDPAQLLPETTTKAEVANQRRHPFRLFGRQ